MVAGAVAVTLLEQILDEVKRAGELGISRLHLEQALPRCSGDAIGIKVWELKRKNVLKEDSYGLLRIVETGPLQHVDAAAAGGLASPPSQEGGAPATAAPASPEITAVPFPGKVHVHRHTGESDPSPRAPEEIAMAAMTKACSLCGERKPLSEFYKGQGRCKPCHTLKQRENYAKRMGTAPPVAPIAPKLKKPGKPVRRKKGDRIPRTAAPAAPTPPTSVAYFIFENGVRIGRTEVNKYGIVVMPSYVDLSDDQLDAMLKTRDELRKAAA